jgi:hypothetical protein
MTVFSNTSLNTGILQQARDMARVDSTQWDTYKVVNSCNNWLDHIFSVGKSLDRNFQLDDTNHTKLPIGTTNIVSGQSDYSFLTDEQGNRITNITRIDMLDSSGSWHQLSKIDQGDITEALDAYESTDGTPKEYDLIADNIVRLYPTPASNVTNGLKFYFQRTPSYFAAADTTKEPGVANDLHRGFIVASAYDIAFTLGLDNLKALSVELQKEEKKIVDYFSTRNSDSKGRMSPAKENNR